MNKEKNNRWKGGVGQRARSLVNYREWVQSVFARDDYTCHLCGARGGKLQAHHILPWSTHPDLRFEVSNGQTFCVECHRKHHRDEWSIYSDACVVCGTSKREHHALGMCDSCYRKQRRRLHLE